MTVKQMMTAAGIATAILAGSTEALAAGPPANPTSSCVALITSYEATQLPAGSVGQEVRGLATSGPGLGAVLVGPLAGYHLGSFDACREVEA